jgi:beta-lactamase regulating signal transducer with metallopeptidase domain
MTVAVWLPFVASVVVALLAWPVAARVNPRRGAWLFALTGLVAAACSTWALLLLTVSLVDDIPGTYLNEALPIADPPSVVASGVLLIVAARLVTVLHRQRDLMASVRPVVASSDGELVVIPDRRPLAFAAPGRPGRIVVTDSMLSGLTSDQRRVVLAHERAHLSGRHSTAITIAQLAAAANPLLIPVKNAVAFLCERDADEQAAREVGDRVLVAEALTAAALLTRARSRYTSSLRDVLPVPAFHRYSVVDRVAALTADRGPGVPPAWLGAVGAAAMVAAAAAGYATGVLVGLVAHVGA